MISWILNILEDCLFNVLTEEAQVNILLHLLNLIKGEPASLLNLLGILRKQAVLLWDIVNVVLSCLVLLVAHVILGECNSSLLFELSKRTGEACLVIRLPVALGKGPFLCSSPSHQEDLIIVADAYATIDLPIKRLIGIKCTGERGSHGSCRRRGGVPSPRMGPPVNFASLKGTV